MKESTLPKSPLLVTAVQLGLLLFYLYYTFIGGQTAQGIYDHNWRLKTLWLTALIIGGWLLARLLSHQQIPRTPLDIPLLFVFLSWVLATIFSVNPLYSRETIIFFIIYVFFFYIAADLGRWPWFTELAFNAIIAISGLVWMLALLQFSHWYEDRTVIPVLLQSNVGFAVSLPRLSVLGNPNTMASYIALVLPVVLYKTTAVSKMLTRILLILWIVMLASAILLTQSRGGLLGAAVALSFFVVIWLVQKTGTSKKRLLTNINLPGPIARVSRLVWLLMLGGVMVFATLFWLSSYVRGFSGAIRVRQQVMAGAVKTWLHHPILGAGPGTLGKELVRHQQPLDTIWADAHNLFLTLTAETGLIGAIGLIWLGVTFLKILSKMLGQFKWTQRNLTGLACAASLVGFFTHNLIDSLFKFPLIMVMVSTLAGFWIASFLSSSSSASEDLTMTGFRRPLVAVTMAVFIATIVIGVRGIQNIAAYNQAVQAAVKRDWQNSLAHLKIAEELAPNGSFYQRQTGVVAGYLSEEEPAARQEAISAYQAALTDMDQLPVDHANLGCLLWQEGAPAEAIHEMAIARQLEPKNFLYRFNLAQYLESEGRVEAALDEYAYLLAHWPEYIESSYWSQSEARAQRLPEIIEAAAGHITTSDETSDELEPANLIQLYLYHGDIEAAWEAYEEYLAQARITSNHSQLEKGKILWRQNRIAEAKQAFEAALQLNPRDGEIYFYLSQIALAQGNVLEAEQNVEAALYLWRNSDTLYQAALVAEATGDNARAIELYEAAFMQLISQEGDPDLLRYATEVAKRRPLPMAYLPCLSRIYRSAFLVEITKVEGRLLEQQGNYDRARQVYQRLLKYEPATQIITTRLEALCQTRSWLCDETTTVTVN